MCTKCRAKEAQDKLVYYHNGGTEKRKLWAVKNREKVNKRQCGYTTKRYRDDLCFRMSCVLRTRLRKVLRQQLAGRKPGSRGSSAIKELGCSVSDLVKHIEKQFKDGMSWSNWGEWEIDHIKPLAAFDLTRTEQVQEVCHFSNLQPLWAFENGSKGARFREEKKKAAQVA